MLLSSWRQLINHYWAKAIVIKRSTVSVCEDRPAACENWSCQARNDTLIHQLKFRDDVIAKSPFSCHFDRLDVITAYGRHSNNDNSCAATWGKAQRWHVVSRFTASIFPDVATIAILTWLRESCKSRRSEQRSNGVVTIDLPDAKDEGVHSVGQKRSKVRWRLAKMLLVKV